ncbi:transglycosylase SLT domain protein [Metarhizium robertsii]|uniref:Glycoside hydrolase family 23 protein n=2 Tax=Metarhizium robertsii TaxID=568076 RepID=E9ETI9_METRA|nr:glycoside hydrolase family 23 protein [Metarhizium robertsii ARSEF 23]EFZ00742.1 glycoside hydrolase family 23 protein [Metarhizium robertsii ARSEF 23]EXV03256.1 transglycosylase SLT domain protein [Metarhizium robertsii]
MHTSTIASIASKATCIALASLASAATNTTNTTNTTRIDLNPNAKGACQPPRSGPHACGPNGSQDWLNSGVRGSGWNPPSLDVRNITHIPLKAFYKGVGSPCEKYDRFFKISGMKYDVDPAILAFIAFHESSCNADAPGPAPGLFQCDPSNCQNGMKQCQRPIMENSDCGAHVLRVALNRAGGNIVYALGLYNGWFTAGDRTGLNGGKGLTEEYPCSGEGRAFRVPPDLNYLHDMLNGWFQGYDMRSEDTSTGGTYYCHKH